MKSLRDQAVEAVADAHRSYDEHEEEQRAIPAILVALDAIVAALPGDDS